MASPLLLHSPPMPDHDYGRRIRALIDGRRIRALIAGGSLRFHQGLRAPRRGKIHGAELRVARSAPEDPEGENQQARPYQ